MICVGCVFVGSGRAFLYEFPCERQGVLFSPLFWDSGAAVFSGSSSLLFLLLLPPFLLLGSAWAALLFFCLCCRQDCRRRRQVRRSTCHVSFFSFFLFSLPGRPPSPLSFLSFFLSFFLSLSLSLACAQTQSSPTGFALGVAPRIALVVLLQSWGAIQRMAFRLPSMYVMHAVPGMEFSGSCSENCGGRFVQVVGCHPVTGSSYSGDGILYAL